MIKTNDFDRILQNFSALFEEGHFKKKSPNTYMSPNGIELKFVLDHWGWTENDGLRFMVRLSNRNLLDSNGNIPYIDGEIDVTSKRLQEANLLNGKQYDAYMKALPDSSLPGSHNWYRAYSSSDLEKLLSMLLPIVISYAVNWADAQTAAGHKPEPIKKLSAEQLEKIQHQLRSIGGGQ